MKTKEHKEKTSKGELRSLDDFNKRFYPEPLKSDDPEEAPDPEDVAEKLAKESLDRLQEALSGN